MTRRISISLPWDPRDATEIFERARSADEAGVETIWMNEGFGHDAFSGLTLLATHTSNARIGTAIVNAYSRTPGALLSAAPCLGQHNDIVLKGLLGLSDDEYREYEAADVFF